MSTGNSRKQKVHLFPRYPRKQSAFCPQIIQDSRKDPCRITERSEGLASRVIHMIWMVRIRVEFEAVRRFFEDLVCNPKMKWGYGAQITLSGLVRRRCGRERMDQLIPIINKLQDVFNTLETEPFDLPQIVVCCSLPSVSLPVFLQFVVFRWLAASPVARARY